MAACQEAQKHSKKKHGAVFKQTMKKPNQDLINMLFEQFSWGLVTRFFPISSAFRNYSVHSPCLGLPAEGSVWQLQEEEWGWKLEALFPMEAAASLPLTASGETDSILS